MTLLNYQLVKNTCYFVVHFQELITSMLLIFRMVHVSG